MLEPQQDRKRGSRQRRSTAWACSAGVLGIPRFFYTKILGKSCEKNNVFGLVQTFSTALKALRTMGYLIRTVNGKTVYLPKVTDRLVTKVNQLQSALRYSLLIQPFINYQYHMGKSAGINFLFTIPELSSKNSFCSVEYLTPIKYNISGICFHGPVTRDELALLRCQHNEYILHRSILYSVISHSPLNKPVWELVRTASPFIYHFSLTNHFITFLGHITTTILCDCITTH